MLPDVRIEPTTAYQAVAHLTELPQHSNVIPIQLTFNIDMEHSVVFFILH